MYNQLIPPPGYSLTATIQVSDALLRLQKRVPGQPARAGYLADIIPFAASSAQIARAQAGEKLIAPASTLKYVDRSSQVDALPEGSPNGIPNASHWADETELGSVVVIEQPEGQTNAALGGILALAMKVRGVSGCVVGGRVRDIDELQKVGLPVSSNPLTLLLSRENVQMKRRSAYCVSPLSGPLSNSFLSMWEFTFGVKHPPNLVSLQR